MEATPWLIVFYGSASVGLLLYSALTLTGISKKLDSFHTDVWHHIYKDRI